MDPWQRTVSHNGGSVRQPETVIHQILRQTVTTLMLIGNATVLSI